MRIVSNQ
jgi:hypothetical protein